MKVPEEFSEIRPYEPEEMRQAFDDLLNDRQLLEFKDGRLTVGKVRFCLNTRDDSGDVYELMIRESTQDDYEVVQRIPFRVKLAFVGTDNFDF